MPWNGGWYMGWMGLFWFIVLVLVVLLAGGVRRSSHGSSNPQESREEILKQRYARGEIAKEEYEQKSSDIGKEESWELRWSGRWH